MIFWHHFNEPPGLDKFNFTAPNFLGTQRGETLDSFETLAQKFISEFSKFLKNAYFEEHA